MANVKTITATTTESAVEFSATYQFMWFRNMGENDCLLSDHSGIVAGDDNVTLVKAGESGRISTSGRAVYIKTVSGTSTGEIHAQNFSDAPFKSKAKGGGQPITVEPLTVNDNGVYTAPTGKAYSPVSVDVQDQPWQPLEDGYSNFWFDLTNDTLSPWLNFSAKNANAVIDWGDGSGEVTLDTLTPTHTYSKAGKYVVKVKGVTGIGRQFNIPVTDSDVAKYMHSLTAVELNQDVQTSSNYMFFSCFNLKNVDLTQTDLTTILFASFQYCPNIINLKFPTNLAAVGGQLCIYNSMSEIILPSTVTEINTSAFLNCYGLGKIHIRATTPPTLGNTVFTNLPSNFIIYVPVGAGDTYKAAEGWSTYADHILEEGQTPNRAMLAKFNSTKTDEPQDDMR